MSVSFERNGKWVKLQEFSNHDVIDYLALKLNINNPRLKMVAKPKFGNAVMVRYNDVYFIIHADKTYIELSFYQTDAEELSTVIKEITRWDRFSKTEKTFYVQIDENHSRTIIFENGYATYGDWI